jgi:peptidoglycan/LPS O-acetylase OafA/YrhL
MTEPIPPASRHARYDTLDGMRGIAAISVMIFHFTQYHTPRPFNSAGLAVDLFFMLSGFVIAHSYGRRLLEGMSAGEYVGRRLIRLHPTFVVGILLGAVVLYWLQNAGMATAPTGPLAAGTLANLFYLPFFNDFSIQVMGSPLYSTPKIFPGNPPAWSLFFEIIASLGFLALFRLRRAALVTIVASSFIAFLACGFIRSHFDHRLGVDMDLGWGPQIFFGGFPRVIYGFSCGLLIYSLATDASFRALQPARAFITRYVTNSWLVYAVLLPVLLFPVALRGIYPTLILLTAAPALLYIGSLVPCHTPASLQTARFLGWISYPLYCLHLPIGRAVFLVAGRAHWSNNVALPLSIVLSFALAALLTKVCEEPVRAWLSRKLAQSLQPVRPPGVVTSLSPGPSTSS